MNELLFLFITLTIVGVILFVLKKKLELEAERKIIHYMAWIFTLIGGIGSIVMTIGYFFVATP